MPIGEASRCFAFEADFMGSWRCIPLCVRRKLDLSGIKLKLRHWLALDQRERQHWLDWWTGRTGLRISGILRCISNNAPPRWGLVRSGSYPSPGMPHGSGNSPLPN